jgi:FkbM family methyltransferase
MPLTRPFSRALSRVVRIPHGVYRRAKIATLGAAPSWRNVPGGLQACIDPRDPFDCLYYCGLYEPHLFQLIGQVVHAGDVCLDIGAQKGYVAMRLARAVGPTGGVIAVEPDPRALDILRRNCTRNGLRNIRTFACAAAEAAGSCHFLLSSRLGWSTRFPNALAQTVPSQPTTVTTRTVDELVASGSLPPDRRIVFLKIDVEGSEPLVLRGAAETLRTHRPTLFLEINRGSLRAGGFSHDDIERPLLALGYRFRAISPRCSLLTPRFEFPLLSRLSAVSADCFDVIAEHPVAL